MPKITCNDPKKVLLRDFNSAFANNDAEAILNNIDENIIWEMVGNEIYNGKKEVEEALPEMLDGSIEELDIEKIITHEEEGSVNGTMKFKDGTAYGFCDVYTFTNHSPDAKIKSITSYVVEKS